MRVDGVVVRVVASAMLLMIAEGHAGSRKDRPVRPTEPAGEVIPGVVIVAVRDGAALSDLSLPGEGTPLGRALRARSVTKTRRLFPPATSGISSAPYAKSAGPSEAQARVGRILECSVPLDADPVRIAELLSRDPSVEYAEPKYMHTLYDAPDDPLFGSQFAFTPLNAVAGWSLGKGDRSLLIANVDGGTDWRHPDLLPNVRINTLEDLNRDGVFDASDLNGVDEDGNGFVDDVVGWNFTNKSPDPSGLAATPLSYAHGTATASHFGAVTNNGIGIAGSGWNNALLPVCVASSTTDNGIAFGYEGIAYAAARGAKVINCSWGRIGGFSQFEQDVITAATDAGALVIAAAGNNNSNSDAVPHYPSNYRGVLAVGATESTSDTKASFSNYGVTVPVYAPGVNILSAFVGGGYGSGGSGTSYSSPLVAGLAGILRVAYPGWTPAQIAAQIRMTADPIDFNNPVFAGLLGKGRVNFARALTEAHVGLDVIASDVRTSTGRRLFLPGDTILVTLTLKNSLFLDAANVSFNAASSAPSMVQLVEVPANVGLLAAGQTLQLPPFRFRVGNVPSTSSSVVRLRWTVNGTDADGTALNVWVFPVLPQWVMQLDGAEAGLFSVFAVNRSVVWAAGGNPAGAQPIVVRTTDAGETWTDQTGSLTSGEFYCVNALDANRAWVGTGDGRIIATTDGGTTWNVQAYPDRQSPFINGIRMFSDGTGYAQGDPPGDAKFVVLKTTNFGSTWSHLANEPQGTSGEAGWNNSFWWTDQMNGWFGTNHNKVWRTTDGGGTWASAATGGTNSYGVAFRDASTGYAVHDNGYVARTTNGGQSWSGLTSPTSEMVSSVTVAPATSSAWITTAYSSFRTRNDGAGWTSETLFPVLGSLNHLSFADTASGWVVTSNGEILRYSAGVVTSAGEISAPTIPLSVALDHNYPNPFNGSSIIGYRIQGTGLHAVRVMVYDLLGREVALLAQGTHAAGAYTVVFDARDRASGVYVCVLEVRPADGAAPIRISQQMVLIR